MIRRLSILSLAVLGVGCSVQDMAAEAMADALSGSGGVFSRDGDPELVREAIPFGLKTYEGLLDRLPGHRGLLLACASGFAQYAYAFVLEEADRLDASDLVRARALRLRARALFLRGRDYALRGLETRHPGFGAALKAGRTAALARLDAEDLPFLYWAAAAWSAALVSAKADLDLVAELPIPGEMLARGLELDESWNDGALHEVLISFEGGRSEAMGGNAGRARRHYRRAVELSRGLRASPHLALAEALSVREQNVKEFKDLLDAAEAVDPDADPDRRLENVLARRRAAWLRTRIPDLFLDDDGGGGKQ
jgi:predicted anti-sigma-YlaC factor YlaD